MSPEEQREIEENVVAKDTFVTDTSCEGIVDAANRLRYIAASLEGVGMDSLSERIWMIIEDLDAGVKKVRDAVSEEIGRQVKRTSSMSKTVFDSVLAGIELQSRAYEDGVESGKDQV